jgi:hypothetical protein
MSDNGDYEPGYVVKLNPHKVHGKTQGYYVYLRRSELSEALWGGSSGSEIPSEIRATRTVLDPGTGQILIRLKVNV